MKVFVINPERGASEKEKFFTENLVLALEDTGNEVWWSKRDNPDNLSAVDRSHINFEKVFEADMVYVVYSKHSSGSIFELGWLWGLYMLFKILFSEINQKSSTPQIKFANKSWFENDKDDPFLNILYYLEIATSKNPVV